MDGSGPHGVVQLPGIAWFKIKASKRIILQNVADVFQAELSTMKYVVCYVFHYIMPDVKRDDVLVRYDNLRQQTLHGRNVANECS